VACQYDVLEHMLLKPILSGRVGKWAYMLVEYDLAYEPLRSMKGQVVADFIVDHAIDVDHSVNFVQLKLWGLYFDCLVCSKGQGARCVIISCSVMYIDLSVRLEFSCINDQVEYESLLHELEYLRDLGARGIDVFGDSNLIIQQIRGDSQCSDGVLNSYRDRCLDIIKLFDTFSIKHIPQEENSRANQLAQQALGYVITQGVFWVTSVRMVENRYALRSKGKLMLENLDRLQDKGKPILDKAHQLSGNSKPESGNMGESQEKAKLTSGKEANESVTMENRFEKVGSPLDEEKMKPIRVDELAKDGDTVQIDWRLPLMECIRDLGKITNKKIKRQVLKYTSLDDSLYRRTIDGVLLKCLSDEQAKEAVQEVHDGISGAHQSAHKMKWLLRRAGFYWPTMVADCIKYQKGCEACQWFRNVQLAHAGVMNSIMKPWPFRGWGLDFISEIHPGSSKGHQFILVAMDYFTKWTEVVPLRNMTHQEVISFVQEHIIYWFGVPQSSTTDQGPLLMLHQFREFTESMKIKLMNFLHIMHKQMVKLRLATRC
jgi:ribonuclease HI